MKNPKVIAAVAVIAIIILSKLGVLDALVIFLLVGGLPGTTFSLPYYLMLLLMVVAMWVVLFRFAAVKALHIRAARKLAKKAAEHKKRLPKRRFVQIHDSAS